MNAPEKKLSENITLRLDGATVTVPAELAAMAYLEQLLDERRPTRVDVAWTAPLRRATPAFGAGYGGGKFAGITVHDNVPCELVLLEGENESCTWKEALAWAEEQGGVLPSRFDQLVLLKNLKSEFQEAWYWSSEQLAGDESYAWYQDFYYGNQDWSHVSGHYRARAVRRLAIQ
jgi:hypothetical protein